MCSVELQQPFVHFLQMLVSRLSSRLCRFSTTTLHFFMEALQHLSHQWQAVHGFFGCAYQREPLLTRGDRGLHCVLGKSLGVVQIPDHILLIEFRPLHVAAKQVAFLPHHTFSENFHNVLCTTEFTEQITHDFPQRAGSTVPSLTSTFLDGPPATRSQRRLAAMQPLDFQIVHFGLQALPLRP
jgi:hypothetical protein